MTGLLALHGGGEFQSGDEPFLRAILEAAAAHAATMTGDGAVRAGVDRAGVDRAGVDRAGVVRAAIVPTAAARGRPDLAASYGVAALQRVATEMDIDLIAEAVRVVDDASAMDPDLAAELALADLIHLPGGDPDLIPSLYPHTAAWVAIEAALARGAVLAGASAGAMALAERTWTPAGIVAGLGLLPGVIVVPHASAASWSRNLRAFGGSVPARLGVLGLAERTGVIGPAGGPWHVVGEGEVRWLAAGQRDPAAALVIRHGDVLSIPTG